MGYIVILKNRVRELRIRMNLRQSDLADEVKVTRQTILAHDASIVPPNTD